MTTPASVRPAEPSDAQEIVRLCQVLNYAVTRDDIDRRLRILCANDNALVGVCGSPRQALAGWVCAERRLVLQSGDRVEIVGLVVDPTRRRQGVGRALVAAVEAWALARGSTSLTVRSNVVRGRSHEFYLGLGYGRKKTQHVYVKTMSGARS